MVSRKEGRIYAVEMRPFHKKVIKMSLVHKSAKNSHIPLKLKITCFLNEDLGKRQEDAYTATLSKSVQVQIISVGVWHNIPDRANIRLTAIYT